MVHISSNLGAIDMSYSIVWVFSIFLLISGSMSPIMPWQQTNGLQWGFNDGMRFDFILETSQVNGEGGDVEDLEFYAVAPSLPPISNDSDSLIRIPFARFDIYLKNGTQFGSTRLAVPIGNWTLLSSIALQQPTLRNESIEIIDTQNEWGFLLEDLNPPDYRYWYKIKFSKIDGVLTEESQVFHDWHGNVRDIFNTTRIEEEATYLSITTSVISLAIIVMTLVVMQKTRHRK